MCILKQMTLLKSDETVAALSLNIHIIHLTASAKQSNNPVDNQQKSLTQYIQTKCLQCPSFPTTSYNNGVSEVSEVSQLLQGSGLDDSPREVPHGYWTTKFNLKAYPISCILQMNITFSNTQSVRLACQLLVSSHLIGPLNWPA